MGAWATKSTGNTLTAVEFNLLANEIENQETAGTETPSAGSSDQLAKSIVNVVGNGDFYTGGGIADVYTATVVAPNKLPTSYRVGMRVRFRSSVTNTGASTINVASLGVKNIKLQNGSSDPVAGDIPTFRDTELRYDGTNFIIVSPVASSVIISGIVELLTNAELKTGTDSLRAATASAILSLFTASDVALPTDIRIPINIAGTFEELIIQTAIINVGASSSGLETFGTTFPTATLFIGLHDITAVGAGVKVTVNDTAYLTTGFNWTSDVDLGVGTYIAIGY